MNDKEHAQGDLPSRSSASVTIGLGLLSIPCSVFAGLDEHRGVERHEYTVEGDPVGRQPYNKNTGQTLTKGTPIVKRTEALDGTLVDLTDEELAEITTGPQGLAEITTFIPLDSIGSTYSIDGYNQVRPAKRKVGRKSFPDPAAEKAFGLLLSALGVRSVAALVKFASRGPARYAALRPDGLLVRLAFAEQVRKALDLPERSHSEAEHGMAVALVDAIGVSTPVLMDDAAPLVADFIAKRAAGGESVKSVSTPPVADLTATLEAMLAKRIAVPSRTPRKSATRKRNPAKKAPAVAQ